MQYIEKGIPVLEVGPTFFKLSDLDRRRTLKLLADYSEVSRTAPRSSSCATGTRKRTVGNLVDDKGLQGMHLD